LNVTSWSQHIPTILIYFKSIIMKKKSLADLLRKIEQAEGTTGAELTNLNDQLSKKMLKGGYVTSNGTCSGGYNNSCGNTSCTGGLNGTCHNGSCLI
jgi:hypothetical protein